MLQTGSGQNMVDGNVFAFNLRNEGRIHRWLAYVLPGVAPGLLDSWSRGLRINVCNRASKMVLIVMPVRHRYQTIHTSCMPLTACLYCIWKTGIWHCVCHLLLLCNKRRQFTSSLAKALLPCDFTKTCSVDRYIQFSAVTISFIPQKMLYQNIQLIIPRSLDGWARNTC